MLDVTGLGPGPDCAMLLGDLGADVIRLERPGSGRFREPHKFIPHRSRRSIVVDLSRSDGVALVLRLVYARMTGWGQDGPMAREPGHDVNYLAVVGALSRFRRAGERPLFPLNLAADYGGGGTILAFGIACALFERATSGKGQVIDGAMIDGVAGQLSLPLAHQAMGRLSPVGTNFNDTGSRYYEVYETSDNRYLAIGALEPKFYETVLDRLGLAERTDLPDQNDRSGWPMMKELFASIIGSRPLSDWTQIFDGAEACVSPVLELDEAVTHPHAVARGTFIEQDGLMQPGVAPRFSRTPGAIASAAPVTGAHTDEILTELAYSSAEIAMLRNSGVVA